MLSQLRLKFGFGVDLWGMLNSSNQVRVVIPARLGSKRIPRKNIQLLDGEPLIGHTIRSLLDSGLFQEVFVSTESLEIKEIAESYGARVPNLRDDAFSSDEVSTLRVIQEFLNRQPEISNETPVLCVYPFAVFLNKETLQLALERLEEVRKDKDYFVVAIKEYPHPISRALQLGCKNILVPSNIELMNSRTQDLQTSFHDAGQFYLANKDLWLTVDSIFDHAKGLVLNDWRMMDLDTPEDWERLKSIWNFKKFNNV